MNTPRILIVDDEQSVISAVSRCFLDTNYEISTAISGAEGLDLLTARGPVDLIISDFRMPGMNGVDFLRQVMAKWPGIKRMILSAYTDSDILLSALNEGRVHRFVTKPWKNEELIAVVEELLGEVDVLDSVKHEVEGLVRRNQILAATNDQLRTLLTELLNTVRSENSARADITEMASDLSDELQILKKLSDREIQILKCLAIGQRPKEIAQDLAINIKTVSTYKQRLYGKMGFKSEADLIKFSIKHKLVLPH